MSPGTTVHREDFPLVFLIVWPNDSIKHNCLRLFCLFHISLLFSGTSRWHSEFYSITRVSATLLSSGFDDFMRTWWRSEVDVAQSLTEIESSVDITRLSKASKRVLKVNNCWNFSARTCHLGGIMWGRGNTLQLQSKTGVVLPHSVDQPVVHTFSFLHGKTADSAGRSFLQWVYTPLMIPPRFWPIQPQTLPFQTWDCWAMLVVVVITRQHLWFEFPTNSSQIEAFHIAWFRFAHWVVKFSSKQSNHIMKHSDLIIWGFSE